MTSDVTVHIVPLVMRLFFHIAEGSDCAGKRCAYQALPRPAFEDLCGRASLCGRAVILRRLRAMALTAEEMLR